LMRLKCFPKQTNYRRWFQTPPQSCLNGGWSIGCADLGENGAWRAVSAPRPNRTLHAGRRLGKLSRNRRAIAGPALPFVAVGNNLSDPDNTFAGIFLSHLPQVLSERRCLMMEGRARLRGIGLLYRSALYPLSQDGVAIDHVLGAANYRPLRENEEQKARLIRTKWL
jgi:hypothetical protein